MVGAVIKESVEEYLRHVSFSSPAEVAEHLQQLGFHLDHIRESFPLIEGLMKRRHQIVHRADHDERGKLVPIDKNQILEWADAVTRFLSQVLAQLGNKEAFLRVEQLLVEIARERGIEL
jgi:hypothetical protein